VSEDTARSVALSIVPVSKKNVRFPCWCQCWLAVLFDSDRALGDNHRAGCPPVARCSKKGHAYLVNLRVLRYNTVTFFLLWSSA
jgi:hypothetical protein